MKTKLIITLAMMMFIFCSYNSQAQTQKVRDYLKMVAMGKVADVKKQIPDLLAEFPNDPGVQLLLAVVIDDAFLAVEKYKNIVKSFPESEWADDAYWRIVQFYAVIGDTSSAKSVTTAIPKQEPVKKEETKITGTKPKQETVKKEDIKPEVKKVDTKPKVDIAKKEEIKPADTKTIQEVKKEIQAEVQENEKYGLQVGVYSTKDAADNEVAKFKQQRLISYVMNKDIDGTQMYAVVVGEYSSKESAEQARKIVQVQCKCQPIIFKK